MTIEEIRKRFIEDHLATYAVYGLTGKRIGTRYCYSYEDIQKNIGKRYFKFRNEDIKKEYWKESQNDD